MVKFAKEIEESCVGFVDAAGLHVSQAAVVKVAKEIEQSCVVFIDATGFPDGSYGEAREGD